MIEVYGDLCSKTRSDDFINNINNEYLQSVIQKYKFTYQDHIYEKNNKIYQYNNQTLKFDGFKTIFRPQIIFMCTNPLMKNVILEPEKNVNHVIYINQNFVFHVM